jgi:hypothetical protein
MGRTPSLFFTSLSACLAACAALAGGCHDTEAVNGGPLMPPPPPAIGKAVDDAAAWMAGNWSSAEQAAADTNYYDVRLHIARIWPDRTDGPWFYVEQAMADTQGTPYRQRVYHLIDAPGDACESVVYELPGDPLAFAGAWQDPTRMNAMDPTLLEPRMGCSVKLRRGADGTLSGGTEGDGCSSNRRGAAYATSQVTVAPTLLLSWDRGFGTDGKQVWGAVTGPYRFVKEGSQP